MAAAANTAPRAGFPNASALPGSLSNLDSDSAEREGGAGNPAPGAEFSPSSEIPKMQGGGSLEPVASEPCAASHEASQCAVPAKKAGIGIGVPLNLCDESRSIRTWSAALSFAPPVFGGSTCRRKPGRFSQEVPGTPTRRATALIGVRSVGFCKPNLLEASHG